MSKQTYKIAHIRDQGKDVIIVPISNMNNALPSAKLNEIKAIFQAHAIDTKLSGEVCLVWEFERKLCFLASNQWKPFCARLNMNMVKKHINKELTF